MNYTDIAIQVDDALTAQPVLDMHTHLFAPSFGSPVPNATGKTDPAGLLLWGIDELVTYHYLVAEVYRVVPATTLPYESFWKMSKSRAGGPHLETPVRRAHAHLRSLPRRSHHPAKARTESQRKDPRPLPKILRSL